MYKQYKLPNGEIAQGIKRIADNSFIPFDHDNTDYQAYLKWVAEGNSPYPADSATPESAE